MKGFLRHFLLTLSVAFAAYITQAQTPTWAFNIGSSLAATTANGTDLGFACKVAANGNVYLTGKFHGTADLDPGPGVYNVTSAGQTDIFVACYSGAGVFIWGFGVGGVNYEGALGIATDAASNLVITGFHQGGVDFDPGPGVAIMAFAGGAVSDWEGDGFIAKYSSTGAYMWGHTLGGATQYDYGESVEIDAANNIYAGGEFTGSMVVSPFVTLVSLAGGNGYLIKYDPAGNVIWGRNIGQTGVSSDCVVRSIKVRGDALYIGGVFRGTADFNTWGTPQLLTAAGGPTATDAFVAKYDTASNFQWVKQVAGTGNADEYGAIALDATGNLYAAGWGNSASFVFDIGLPATTTVPAPGGGGNLDIIFAKYSSIGDVVWCKAVGGVGVDMNRKGLEIIGGRLFLAGQFQGTADFDPSAGAGILTSTGLNDLYLAQYDLDANYQCSYATGAATTNDAAMGMTRDAAGFLYVTGQFGGSTVDFNPAPAVTPLTSNGGTDAFFVKYNPECVVLDCSNVITLPDTVSLCLGDTMTIAGSITGVDSVMTITWSPVSGLSSSTIINPVVTGTVPGYKYVTVNSLLAYNLVTNGNFSGGNLGFTSSYTYAPPPSGVLVEGNYSVHTNPFGVHTGFTSMGDHTSGTGSMMIINGGSTGADVWCTTISVTPNTDYDFSAWFANCSSVTTGADVPILQFRINGVLIGTPTTVSSAPGTWVSFSNIWNSGTATSANICIYDATTAAAGNDFAIDDISFRKICVQTDSVYIAPAIPDTTFNVTDTSLCANLVPLTLAGPTGFDSYRWVTGATTAFITASVSGEYWVRSINGCHVQLDTFHVDVVPMPTVALGADTAFCIGNTYVLSSPQPTGSTHIWNTGATTDTIHIASSGRYWVQVTGPTGCVAADTINIAVSPFPIVDLGRDTFDCTGAPILLYSRATYTAPTYLWQDMSVAPTFTATTSGTYWLQVTDGGCAAADTIHITIKYDTFTLYNVDTAICLGKSVSVAITYNPEIEFQWLPTAGIMLPNVPGPVITPDTSAMYVVIGRIEGCPDKLDSFYIDVQPNPTVRIGGTRQVCEWDTLQLKSLVTPGWYRHYIYNWSPATWVDHTSDDAVIYTAGGTSGMISLTVTTPAGCMGADSSMIIVNPSNFATISTDTAVCPRDSVQLVATGGIGYSWSPARYLSDANAAMPWAKPETDQVYTLVATSDKNCKDTLTVKVKVHPAAVTNIPDSVRLYPGESYEIPTQTNCVRFLWSPAVGLSDRYIANPIAMPTIESRYILLSTTENGCVGKDSINVFVDPNTIIKMPNAFIPTSGKLMVGKRGLARLNYYRIYNRWGNLVYDGADIEDGWDGTYKGVPQDLGVYVYTVEAITLTGERVSKQGNVTLIR